MFLAYTSMDDLTPTYRFELATDMALAALSGENIYNFGEVLATPILASLKGKACLSVEFILFQEM